MNKDEYVNAGRPRNSYYKRVHEELKRWKAENNITEQCTVHHRDDSDEVRAYNEAHYERWGLDENGDFVEGKYVIFMTCADHARYHHTGEKNHWYGKGYLFTGEKNPNYGNTLSDEAKQKISDARKGKTLSEEHKKKISDAIKGEKNGMYGKGYLLVGEKNGMYGKTGEKAPRYGKHHTEETKRKMAIRMEIVSSLWKLYKQLHSESKMTFNEFQRSLKTNKES